MTEIERLTDEMKEYTERAVEVSYMVDEIERTIRGIEKMTVTDALCPKEIEAYIKLWKDRDALVKVIADFNCEIKKRMVRIREIKSSKT